MAPRKGKVNNPTGKGGFKKGQKSANPGGRSKKQREIEEVCQKIVEGTGKEKDWAVKMLKEIAQGVEKLGDLERYVKTSDRMKAIEMLMSYAYGRPRQRTEISPGKNEDGESWTLKFGDQILEFK